MVTPQPTLAGFIQFIANTMKIPAAILPPTSPYIGWALGGAMATVNPDLVNVGFPTVDAAGVSLGTIWDTIYTEAVYNLAADRLITITPDQPGRSYFENLRTDLNINGFVSGLVQSTGNDASNVSIVVQDAAKAFTLSDLQNLKTPWGRRYLAIAQNYGPSTWGLS